MAKMQSTLAWTEIDPTELSPDARNAYEAYKEQYRAAKKAKAAFETVARREIPAPAGKEVKFAYNFGKLSIALADASEAKAAAKGKLSLADWIKEQASQGRVQ